MGLLALGFTGLSACGHAHAGFSSQRHPHHRPQQFTHEYHREFEASMSRNRQEMAARWRKSEDSEDSEESWGQNTWGEVQRSLGIEGTDGSSGREEEAKDAFRELVAKRQTDFEREAEEETQALGRFRGAQRSPDAHEPIGSLKDLAEEARFEAEAKEMTRKRHAKAKRGFRPTAARKPSVEAEQAALRMKAAAEETKLRTAEVVDEETDTRNAKAEERHFRARARRDAEIRKAEEEAAREAERKREEKAREIEERAAREAQEQTEREVAEAERVKEQKRKEAIEAGKKKNLSGSMPGNWSGGAQAEAASAAPLQGLANSYETPQNSSSVAAPTEKQVQEEGHQNQQVQMQQEEQVQVQQVQKPESKQDGEGMNSAEQEDETKASVSPAQVAADTWPDDQDFLHDDSHDPDALARRAAAEAAMVHR